MISSTRSFFSLTSTVQAGINIVLRAIEAPIRQIAENSGVEGSIAQSEEYVDMLSAGIVDPAKVVRVALQDAASIARLLITTEAMVAEAPKRESAPGDARRRNGRHGRNGLLGRLIRIGRK